MITQRVGHLAVHVADWVQSLASHMVLRVPPGVIPECRARLVSLEHGWV